MDNDPIKKSLMSPLAFPVIGLVLGILGFYLDAGFWFTVLCCLAIGWALERWQQRNKASEENIKEAIEARPSYAEMTITKEALTGFTDEEIAHMDELTKDILVSMYLSQPPEKRVAMLEQRKRNLLSLGD